MITLIKPLISFLKKRTNHLILAANINLFWIYWRIKAEIYGSVLGTAVACGNTMENHLKIIFLLPIIICEMKTIAPLIK